MAFELTKDIIISSDGNYNIIVDMKVKSSGRGKKKEGEEKKSGYKWRRMFYPNIHSAIIGIFETLIKRHPKMKAVKNADSLEKKAVRDKIRKQYGQFEEFSNLIRNLQAGLVKAAPKINMSDIIKELDEKAKEREEKRRAKKEIV